MKSIKSSKSETGRKSFSSVFRYNIRRFWAVPALYMLALIAACPIVCILVTEPGEDRTQFFMGMADNRYVITNIACVGMSIAMGIGVYEYIQNVKLSNYIHSLPIKRGRLFTYNYISGIIMLFAPPAITAFVMMPLGAGFPGMMRWMLMSWLMSAVIYGITVFAGTVSGTVFMHVFNSLFFIFIIAIMITVVDVYAHMMLYGYATSQILGEVISNSVPFIALYGIPSPGIIMAYILIWVGLSLISLMIYKKRAIENTGNSLAFNWTKSFFIGVISFIGTCYMGYMFGFFAETGKMGTAMVTGMILGFVSSFLVISIIVYKGPRIFTKQNMITGCIAVLVTVLFTGSMVTDVTGYEKKTFEPENFIAAGVVGLTGYTSRFDPDLFNVKKELEAADEDGNKALVMKDKGNIDAVCSIQKTLALKGSKTGEVSAYDNVNTRYEALTVIGKTEKGKSISRTYQGIDDRTEALLKKDFAQIYESEEFKDAFMLSNLIYNPASIYIYRSDDYEYDNEMDVSGKKKDELIKAIDQDFAEQTFESFETAQMLNESEEPKEPYYEVSLRLGDEAEITVIVTKDQKNAWKWIQEIGSV